MILYCQLPYKMPIKHKFREKYEIVPFEIEILPQFETKDYFTTIFFFTISIEIASLIILIQNKDNEELQMALAKMWETVLGQKKSSWPNMCGRVCLSSSPSPAVGVPEILRSSSGEL